jgi:hypothetical protein
VWLPVSGEPLIRAFALREKLGGKATASTADSVTVKPS